ncbi:pyridoxal phosphate-dependent class II aminotransferase [Gilvimarinus sp. SDUM040013]|uniref:Aminotransferase n=1 Tax=Gilvimarinus gilvus TaxID=3058038 RepID=A0ABU4S0U8_9GAMM|nr:threonine-phosphate decarboxylase [Gilvimarinus sp. SDUM040013]MDO3384567.1 pyridoxal phosphate-dependent class II aminotransferase [Gilvimarinus sp. SDUM040013]MDX6850097.1 threonine-phosphate decarboxylase [Gilvimarinus sp. SDUM040013]
MKTTVSSQHVAPVQDATTRSVDYPAHGGDLAYASRVFGLPDAGWQDLSTGISPWSYPLGAVPESVWHDLPNNVAPLLTAASRFYGVAAQCLTPVPGSQYAIERLPNMLAATGPSDVAVPAVGYCEHARRWRHAGHHVKYYASVTELGQLIKSKSIAHAVVINPNNPTGVSIAKNQLAQFACALPGWLIVDEAFVDIDMTQSLATNIQDHDNLIVLRSVGKFFGLAGLRLGFVLTSDQTNIREVVAPWSVSGPALWAGVKALQDSDWQQRQRARIRSASEKLERVLRSCLTENIALVNSGLFITLTSMREAAVNDYLFEVYKNLACSGVYTRWGYECGDAVSGWLRIGLPDDDCHRIASALRQFKYSAGPV